MKDAKKKRLTPNRGSWLEQSYKTVKVSQDVQTVNVGGRPSLPDNYLTGAYWSLVNILEKGWPLVGLDLERIRAARKPKGLESIRIALEPLRTWGEGSLYRFLLCPNPKPVTAKDLRRLRHELGDTVGEYLKANEAARNQTDLLNESTYALQTSKNYSAQAMHLLKSLVQFIIAFPLLERISIMLFFWQQIMKKMEKSCSMVEMVHEERIRELQHQESIQAEARTRQISLEHELDEKRAFFVQSQALDFLQDERYSLTPRNFAAALAGLTDMQWRQSIARCKKIGCDMAVDTRYQVLQAMFYILRDSPKNAVIEDVAHFFRESIQQLPEKHNHARKYLGEHWSELRCAIEYSWEKGTRPRVLAYKITMDFLEELGRPTTALDRVLRTIEKF